MGIEPTGPTVYVGPNGFEDRGHHQVYKHFHRSSNASGVGCLVLCDSRGEIEGYAQSSPVAFFSRCS